MTAARQAQDALKNNEEAERAQDETLKLAAKDFAAAEVALCSPPKLSHW